MLTISVNRTAPLSLKSSAQRGAYPHAMTAKQADRRSGRYSVSNGQLMKTDRARLSFDPTGEGIGIL